MSFLKNITPVILTYNEAPNIERCLEKLAWARDIVVVDSGSDDGTTEIIANASAVRSFQRPFDTHARQWTYAITETGIETDWVLALDADHILTDELISEIDALQPDEHLNGYRTNFRYAISGRVIRSGIYPGIVNLYRRSKAEYVQDGHTQRAIVEGPVHTLSARAIHDDRKPLKRWLTAQAAYAELEVQKMQTSPGSLRKFLRMHTPFAPALVAIYCLLVRGGLFEGSAGWIYAWQRAVAEAIISVTWHEHILGASDANASVAKQESNADQ